jgi:hypothetical protein
MITRTVTASVPPAIVDHRVDDHAGLDQVRQCGFEVVLGHHYWINEASIVPVAAADAPVITASTRQIAGSGNGELASAVAAAPG